MATIAQAKFLQALTVTDQLSPSERARHAGHQRSRERHGLRADRYEAWMLATAAFHRAMAATELACLSRIHDHDDRPARNNDELSEVQTFIVAADRFMLLPFVNREDKKARQVLARQWGKCARTVQTAPIYNAARARWDSYLAQEGR